MTESSFILYGAPISYFTGKVRAYLTWKNIPFEEVLSDATVYREIIVPRVGFPVIPVVHTPEGETLQDSSHIIDVLEDRFTEPSITPAGSVQSLVSSLLELYGDEWLVIPAMHYRWHYNRDWAIAQFGATNAPNASLEEQKEIGERRAGPFANAAVMLGGEPHMHTAIETSYEALLAELDAHFSVHNYLLGDCPCLGDFSLFGPLYAHQYRDPKSGEIMRRLAPNLVAWILRMCEPPSIRNGNYLPNDEIPASLLPVLKRMMREQLPAMVDLNKKLCEWINNNPAQEIPRVIGLHEFALEGKTGKRILRPYSLWMLQRARDQYSALEGTALSLADELFDKVGGGAFKNYQDPLRLERMGMSVKTV